MNKKPSIKRIPVYRYKKSGKLTAISGKEGYEQHTAIDLTSDMSGIAKVRSPKFVRTDAIETTPYTAEFEITFIEKDASNVLRRFRLLRVLSPSDIDETKWATTENLDELPVLAYPSHVTKEERIWAGERAGNLGGGIMLASITAGSAWFLVTGYLEQGTYVFPGLVLLVSGFFLVKYRWKLPKRATQERLARLDEHKQSLCENRRSDLENSRTELERALQDYETWKSLSPHEFEIALSLRLENEGYEVSMTQYANDGGVDIEAKAGDGTPVIVQAKQYTGNVGVAVVREMVGVRQGRTDTPRAMIYSLAGFTRGARELAGKEGVELRDIRSELLTTRQP